MRSTQRLQAPLQLGEAGRYLNQRSQQLTGSGDRGIGQFIEPMLQDELILGYQRKLSRLMDWRRQFFIYREVKNGVDDYCGRQAFIDFAEDQGFEDLMPIL